MEVRRISFACRNVPQHRLSGKLEAYKFAPTLLVAFRQRTAPCTEFRGHHDWHPAGRLYIMTGILLVAVRGFRQRLQREGFLAQDWQVIKPRLRLLASGEPRLRLPFS